MPSSETEVGTQQQASVTFENLFLHRLFPFIFGVGGSDSGEVPDRIIFLNPITQTMMVIQPGDHPSSKSGPPPASRSSIESLPTVEITEEDNGLGSECAICLDEWKVGTKVKEMPCKHRFHEECVVKWLGFHGTCPVCRYEMPVEEERKKGEDVGSGVTVRVSFSFSDGDGNLDSSSDRTDQAVEES